MPYLALKAITAPLAGLQGVTEDDAVIMCIPGRQEAPGEQEIPAGTRTIGEKKLLAGTYVARGHTHGAPLQGMIQLPPQSVHHTHSMRIIKLC